MLLVLSTGHGMTSKGYLDAGAVNPATGTREYDLNLAVTSHASTKLAQYGYNLLVDSNIFGKAKDPNWRGWVKYLVEKKISPTLAIEIHHDTYLAPNAQFSILPRVPVVGIRNEKSARLAKLIQDEFVANGFKTKPDYVDVRGLGFLRSFKVPVLIIECGSTVPNSEKELERKGEAIAKGIHNYLQESK